MIFSIQKKYGACLVFATFAFIAAFSQDTTDLLLWSPTPVSWSDFQEQPGYDKYMYKRAKTHWRLKLSFDDSAAVDNKATVKVEALLVRSKSWVRPVNLTDRVLLLHEQLHFDIVEWMARQLRQELSLKTFKKDSYQKEVQRLYKKILGKLNAKQYDYDSDTKGGNITTIQDEWSKTIVAGINELNAFAGTTVTISLQ